MRIPPIGLPLLALALATVPCAQHAYSQSAAPTGAPAWPADAGGVTALATELATQWAGLLSASPEQQGNLMQPGFQMVTFRGSSDKGTAPTQLASVKASGVKVTDVIATRAGNALIVTYLASGSLVVDGKAVPDEPTPRLAVWQPTEAGWRLAALASLAIPAERPTAPPPSFAGDATVNAEGQAMLARFLGAQQRKDMAVFEPMLDPGMQVVNFKGQKARADIIQGAQRATTQPPSIGDARATRSGDLTIVSCNLGMEQKIGFTTLPGTSVPFLAVFQGTGDAAKVIALANTNRPK